MTKKLPPRWKGTNKKYRSEAMKRLALKKSALMTKEERSNLAQKMLKARWGKTTRATS